MKEKKIAIMGAGLSGLSCAFELEKHDIYPDIYEDRREVEDRFINAEGMMDVLTRPIEDSLAFLADQFGLHLQPLHPIKRLEILSQNAQATFEGQMGFITARGRHPQALGKQIQGKLKSKIHFRSQKTYEDLTKDYDIVVLAAGDGLYTRKLQKYTTDVAVKLWGATIKGHFQPTHVRIFLDNRYAPKGYVYLLPFDEENANIAIGTAVDHADMDQLKERLLNGINFSGKIIDEFQVRDYAIGRPEKIRIGNTYFIGNCGGYIYPFMGFGQFGAILSGLTAAKCMVYNLDMEKELAFMRQGYQYSLTLRRVLESMDNEALDQFVAVLSGSLGKFLFNTRKINFLKAAGKLSAPYLTAKKLIGKQDQ